MSLKFLTSNTSQNKRIFNKYFEKFEKRHLHVKFNIMLTMTAAKTYDQRNEKYIKIRRKKKS